MTDDREAELEEGFLDTSQKQRYSGCETGRGLATYLFVYVQFSEDLSGVKEVGVVHNPAEGRSVRRHKSCS